MKTLNAKRKLAEVEYFDELDQKTQDFVREQLIDAIDDCDGWKSSAETISEVECRSRDGFIPFSHNRGGLTANQFTDLNAFFGSGNSVAHKKAQTEIERQIEYSLEYAKEAFFDQNSEALTALGILDKTDKRLNYHDLYEMNQGQLAERLSEAEMESLGGDDSSIMYEVRFMYHGHDAGVHSASISCAVNTEGPYHRSSISWAPNVFCEGATEVEIEWKTFAELKRKLIQALKNTSAKTF